MESGSGLVFLRLHPCLSLNKKSLSCSSSYEEKALEDQECQDPKMASQNEVIERDEIPGIVLRVKKLIEPMQIKI